MTPHTTPAAVVAIEATPRSTPAIVSFTSLPLNALTTTTVMTPPTGPIQAVPTQACQGKVGQRGPRCGGAFGNRPFSESGAGVKPTSTPPHSVRPGMTRPPLRSHALTPFTTPPHT